jgi:hypothetical protein
MIRTMSMAKKKISKSWDQVFKLRITLEDTDPVVWRRVLVPSILTLEKLHSVLQLTMGWQMSHLYGFQINGENYSDPGDFDEPNEFKSVNASIMSALGETKKFIYDYDFGDSWRHVIEVEEIVSREEIYNYPICTGGENACPPEDCGGTGGFADLKKTILKPKDPEYKSMLRWLGGYFDPKTFDPNRINRDLLWQVDWSGDPNDQGLYLPKG